MSKCVKGDLFFNAFLGDNKKKNVLTSLIILLFFFIVHLRCDITV